MSRKLTRLTFTTEKHSWEPGSHSIITTTEKGIDSFWLYASMDVEQLSLEVQGRGFHFIKPSQYLDQNISPDRILTIINSVGESQRVGEVKTIRISHLSSRMGIYGHQRATQATYWITKENYKALHIVRDW